MDFARSQQACCDRVVISAGWTRLEKQRLDKWLFFSRAVKSRTLAQKLIEAGLVRVNSERTDRTDHKVGPGDVLTMTVHSRLLVWLRETVRADPVARTGATLASTSQPPRGAHAFAIAALIAVIVQVALGGLVSAKFAALACPAFPLCGADAPLSALPATLDPFATLAVDATRTIVRPPALAALHWAHRAWAHVVLVLAAILVVVLARDKRRRAALLLALLVVLQLASGAAAVLGDLPLGIVVAHNLIAAILLATLVAIACRYPVSEVQPPVSEV